MLLMVKPFQNVFDIYQAEKVDLKEIMKDKRWALIVEELSDNEVRCILDARALSRL